MPERNLDAAQVGRIGDMDAATFRGHAADVIERIAFYLDRPEAFRVLPEVEPGAVRAALPDVAPTVPESFATILADWVKLIVPATTEWNHPGFFAYFATSGSGPGILAETLSAAMNVNAMLWQSGPAQTELEQVTLSWLAGMLGLPTDWFGEITDTASTSTLYALAAARELAADLRIREDGLAGRGEVPRLRVYCSEEAHSSVDKAVLTLGLGLAGTRRVATTDDFAMDVRALEAAIAEDRAAGVRPLAVVATVGTTGVTAVDPVTRIADVCERERLWLHVDAAYAGAAAVLPEMRWVTDGCERADSMVVNPHKWLFVPIDCSALWTRRPELLRRAFSLTPEYLTTRAAEAHDVVNLMDYGVALGRRFRALKLWFVLRYYGVEGIADRIREHLRLAQVFATLLDEADDFERLMDGRFSVVVFRWHPAGVDDDARLDALNAALLERVNASGEVYLSHTRVRERYALRLAVGNIRTEERHVRRAWELLRDAAQW